MKKVFSIILTVVLIFGIIPVTSIPIEAKENFVGINGLLITEENADDVLGDGTVSYNFDTNTLTLDGASLIKISASGDLNIYLTESENEIRGRDGKDLQAIYVNGDLNISGNGTLTAVGGSIDAIGNHVSSYGIHADGSITVEGANVIGKGGDVHLLIRNDSYATSVGIGAYGKVEIKSMGSVTAVGGSTKGYTAESKGVFTLGNSGSDINVYDGKLSAESGVAEGGYLAISSGVFIVSGEFNIHDVNSTIDVKGGFGKISSASKEETTHVVNSGVYMMGGNVNIYGGTVKVYSEGSSETADVTAGFEVAVTSGYDEATGTITDEGGYMNICSNRPSDTHISVSSLYGSAIVAYKDLTIDKMFKVAAPESGRVNEYGFENQYGKHYHCTVTDKNGEPVKDVNIEADKYVEFMAGDIDIDGIITAKDALLVLQHSANLITLRGYGKAVADVKSDSVINASDALKILKYAANIIDRI